MPKSGDADQQTFPLWQLDRLAAFHARVLALLVRRFQGKTRDVGPENYINRLWMFVAESTFGSTQSKLVLATLQDFGSRIDTVYSLTNKGVHADVAQAEVDRRVMQTYPLAGEILRIFEDSDKGDPAE